MAALHVTVKPHEPLEGSYCKETVSITAGDTAVSAVVSATWASIIIEVLDPPLLAGWRYERRGEGFIAAIACSRIPTRRFNRHGALTPRANGLARRVLRRAIGQARAVERHADAATNLCLRTLQQLEAIRQQRPPHRYAKRRPALKRQFRQGMLTQAGYVRLRKQIEADEEVRQAPFDDQEHQVQQEANRQFEALLARPLTLEPVMTFLQLAQAGNLSQTLATASELLAQYLTDPRTKRPSERHPYDYL